MAGVQSTFAATLGRVVSLFVMCALVFGTIAASAPTHAEDSILSHGSEVAALLDHGDSHEQTGDALCPVVSHHHCGMALTADAPALSPAFAVRDPNLLPLAASAMSSLSQAPPTEPPAA